MYQNNPKSFKSIQNNNFKACFFCSLSLILFWLIGLSSCAVVRAPTGGPRDTLPPRLLGSIPRNYTKEFKGNDVELIFDEFIKIKDQSSSVLISPEPEKQTEIKANKKSIHIRFKSPLLRNTTYSINFGNSIIDYNEGNAYKNFRFVFSTGKRIDSLRITGHVSDPLDTTSKKDVYVILHKAGDDSAIIKKKPMLYTSTDNEGNFELTNIAPGDYSIYALEEANKNKKYDSNTESIAFLNKPIHLVKDTTGIVLNLFKENNDKLKVLNRKITGGIFKVILNEPIDSLDFKLISPVIAGKKYYVEKRIQGDSVLIWLPRADLDSVKAAIYKNGKQVLQVSQNNYVKGRKDRKFIISDNLVNGLKTPARPYELTMSEPLDTLNTDKIQLKEDSLKVSPDSIILNREKVRSYAIYYPWETGRKYTVTVKAASLNSIYENKNQAYLRSFNAGSERNYGTLILNIVVPHKGSYLVELMNEGFKILETRRITNTTTLTYRYLEPGKYRFRVIYDKNNNGRYDTGNLMKKLQSEKIINSKEITIRSNFEQNTRFPLPDL